MSLLGLALAWSSALHGPTTQLRPTLRWRAPPECPSETEVLTRIEELLGTSPTVDGLVVEATVERRGMGYELELTVESLAARVERTIEWDDCRLFGETTALVVAFSTDPMRASEEVDRPQPQRSIPEPPVTPSQGPPVTRRSRFHEQRTADSAPSATSENRQDSSPSGGPETPRRTRLHAALRGEMGVGGGLLPKAGPLMSIAAGIHGSRWGGELDVHHWQMQEGSLDESRMAAIRIWLSTVTMAGCMRALRSRWQARACAGLEVGLFSGTGRGDRVVAARGRSPVLCVAASGGAQFFMVPGIALSARVGLSIPAVYTESFVITGVDRALVLSPVAGYGSLGIEVVFGGRSPAHH